MIKKKIISKAWNDSICAHIFCQTICCSITSNSIFPFLIFLVYCSNDNTRFSLEWGRSNFSTRYVIVFLILLLTTLYRNCACTPRSPRTFFILLPLMFFINKKKKKKKEREKKFILHVSRGRSLGISNNQLII